MMRAFAFYHNRNNRDDVDIVGEDFIAYKANMLDDPHDYEEGMFTVEEIDSELDELLRLGVIMAIEEVYTREEADSLPKTHVSYLKDVDTIKVSDKSVAVSELPYLLS